MQELLQGMRISLPESLYIKDPETSDLGKRIIEHGILLIHEFGIEAFTFKKLGEAIGSNESSIYRYFENKHKLLMYLCSWYWGWLEYKVVLASFSIDNPEKKLVTALEIICQEITEDSNFLYVNEKALNEIIINENSKSFLTKQVDLENKEGSFETYKRLVLRIQQMIQSVSPEYPYPKSLASTVVEASLHQHYLKEHFFNITDIENTGPRDFIINLVLKTII